MSTSTALHLMDEQDPAPTTIQNTEESL
ncbi:hypothetical protein XELAEV_180148352mg, partial [Xenopus laevis]